MFALVAIGVLLTLAGLAGLGYCILEARKTKGMEEGAARARLQQLVAWNLGAVGMAGLGLMALIVGLVLG